MSAVSTVPDLTPPHVEEEATPHLTPPNRLGPCRLEKTQLEYLKLHETKRARKHARFLKEMLSQYSLSLFPSEILQ